MDQVSVKLWPHHGSSLPRNVAVYYQHYQRFYEIDLAMLQLCASMSNKFYDLFESAYGLKELMGAIRNESEDLCVDEKTS
jgi:fructosamine-3-kinase